MSGWNLVKVGGVQDLDNGTFHNVTYACDNVESLLFDFSKSTSATITGDGGFHYGCKISVMMGTKSIVNRMPVGVLLDINQYLSGTGETTPTYPTKTFNTADDDGQGYAELDLGCWHASARGEELTVQISNEWTGTGKVDCQVYAKVNGTSVPNPKKWVVRYDESHILEGAETIYAYATHDHVSNSVNDDLQHDTGNVALQYGGDTVVAPIDGGNIMVNCDTVGDQAVPRLSLLYDGFPRDFVINTNSGASTGGIFIVAECKEVADRQQISKARRYIPKKLSGLNIKEKLLLAQGS